MPLYNRVEMHLRSMDAIIIKTIKEMTEQGHFVEKWARATNVTITLSPGYVLGQGNAPSEETLITAIRHELSRGGVIVDTPIQVETS